MTTWRISESEMLRRYADRKKCKTCKRPVGFCKHTIEEEYRKRYSEAFQDDPIQLSRSLAIAETTKDNVFYNCLQDQQKVNATALEQEKEWDAIKAAFRTIAEHKGEKSGARR
jgi:hypothetical protein